MIGGVRAYDFIASLSVKKCSERVYMMGCAGLSGLLGIGMDPVLGRPPFLTFWTGRFLMGGIINDSSSLSVWFRFLRFMGKSEESRLKSADNSSIGQQFP